jgi:tungstate transport system ATP-binding protein
MLEALGVTHAYGPRTVLRIASLALAPGDRLALVGPNGAGKSTLLRLLALLEPPTAGEIRLDGRALTTERARREGRRRVTMVDQRPFLFRGTVVENAAWGLAARGATPGAAREAAREALALLHSADLAERDTRALSDGEAQRVAVARALAPRPDVLLLDEPTSGADRATQQALAAAIAADQARRPLAVCVVSHQLEEAYRWADRILALHDGVPVPVTPENLFRVELPEGGPLKRVVVRGVPLEVMTERAGAVTLAIPPDEIVLSTEPLHSSARNAVSGRIVRVAEQGPAMRVTVDGGIELVALVTRQSFEALGLRVGGGVIASFKSVAVRVF